MATSAPPASEPTATLVEFLQASPPNVTVQIADLFRPRSNGNGWELCRPDIELHCESDKCKGVRIYRSSESTWISTGWKYEFLKYICRNCESRIRTFAILVFLPKDSTGFGLASKLGEVPPFGPPIPARVISLIGPDREMFLRGRRAENAGLGIGAFAYYRRVVENQKGRIIREIGRVAKRLGADANVLSLFETAEKESQFSTAISTVNTAIPASLRINGQNPLTLLHTALSDGLHDQSDEHCMELATSIRLVLTELAERVTRALEDQQELDAAVNKLLQLKSKPAEKETPPPDGNTEPKS